MPRKSEIDIDDLGMKRRKSKRTSYQEEGMKEERKGKKEEKARWFTSENIIPRGGRNEGRKGNLAIYIYQDRLEKGRDERKKGRGLYLFIYRGG